jgi:hypothetical protein
VSVVCCQVEVSATGWSLVQRSPTVCLKCVIVKPRKMRQPRPLKGLSSHWKKKIISLGYNGLGVILSMYFPVTEKLKDAVTHQQIGNVHCEICAYLLAIRGKHCVLRHQNVTPFGMKNNCRTTKQYITTHTYKQDDKTFLQLSTHITAITCIHNFSNIFRSVLTPLLNNTAEDRECEFRRNKLTTDQFSAFVKYMTINENTMGECIICLQTSRRPMIQIGGRFCTSFLLRLVVLLN